MNNARNVLGEPLKPCSNKPLTVFYRDGCCASGRDDLGRHVVCARMTPEFLEFTRQQGNDLSTPHPEVDFPGLRAGDQWCLCAGRWQEAFEAGVAPRVVLTSTEEGALDVVKLSDLKAHAIDLS